HGRRAAGQLAAVEVGGHGVAEVGARVREPARRLRAGRVRARRRHRRAELRDQRRGDGVPRNADTDRPGAGGERGRRPAARGGGRTSATGRAKRRAASRRAGADTMAIVSAIARSFTRTRIGFPSPRPRTATSRSTARAERASAPIPYTVSVGKTTSSPAASAATAASIDGLREELPLQAEVLPLHPL